MKSAGLRNKVIQNKLKEYVPIKDVMLRISKWFEKLYAIKFQGKPPNKKLLKYSKRDKDVASIKIDKIFFFGLKNY